MLDLSRQKQILTPPENAVIIGAGGIGSNAALVLASIGVEKITIYDGDEVNPENIAPQFLAHTQIGQNKAESVANNINSMLGVEAVHPVPVYVDPITAIEPAVMGILAVDSRAARLKLWRKLSKTVDWLIDTRMGGTTLTVYCIDTKNKQQLREYARTLEAKDSHLPCGMKATAFITRGWAAGAIGQIAYDVGNGRTPPFNIFYDAYVGVCEIIHFKENTNEH